MVSRDTRLQIGSHLFESFGILSEICIGQRLVLHQIVRVDDHPAGTQPETPIAFRLGLGGRNMEVMNQNRGL